MLSKLLFWQFPAFVTHSFSKQCFIPVKECLTLPKRFYCIAKLRHLTKQSCIHLSGISDWCRELISGEHIWRIFHLVKGSKGKLYCTLGLWGLREDICNEYIRIRKHLNFIKLVFLRTLCRLCAYIYGL